MGWGWRNPGEKCPGKGKNQWKVSWGKWKTRDRLPNPKVIPVKKSYPAYVLLGVWVQLLLETVPRKSWWSRISGLVNPLQPRHGLLKSPRTTSPETSNPTSETTLANPAGSVLSSKGDGTHLTTSSVGGL